MPRNGTLLVKHLDQCPYIETWRQMQVYTDQRDENSQDQLWLLEHPPVFTQGQAGKAEHLLSPGTIPVVQTDRGGQITYHGPGQLVAYLLLDLRRAGLGVRSLVTLLEDAVIALLASYGVSAMARKDAPGVYVETAKIASVGLRVRKGCSFHGLSLNVAMDLEPFSRINPCGYPDLPVTQLSEISNQTDTHKVGEDLARQLAQGLGYTLISTSTDSPKQHT
ncbi:MAG: lipoyl(octanoyl) transferase LipB [Candidatus Thiodiazotropha sp. (ex Monitilora ramsayi)]|nr:lipoyl(octanoyl) transferase LipB [Candidatus Thiodiazotropha sp. (ex Monitilora ramsayi)]